ncbi:uncharacterized protein TNCV_3229141 [Trichonephila clavipes]|nr:uncharacterized protein TNCV_3229141 [Trichonephila clavipes]
MVRVSNHGRHAMSSSPIPLKTIYDTNGNLNSSHEFVVLSCQDVNATRRKTSTERMREYRCRRRNAIESGLVQEPQHQVTCVEGSEDATLSNYSDFYRHRLAHEEFKINHKPLITSLYNSIHISQIS